jgi:hypothetical protein
LGIPGVVGVVEDRDVCEVVAALDFHPAAGGWLSFRSVIDAQPTAMIPAAIETTSVTRDLEYVMVAPSASGPRELWHGGN